ncbi:hypothetical protein M5W70_04210 [Paenibacillus larvae]|uniref:Uncharacterized protein n=1 Tax=Paenibacillus larvae TaxID=1464 RepID=A0AAP5JSL3_9BACL|nr:hypothetical protein [Paenibacillus larvae]AQR78969.1 hypothetical protein BXP28_18660 [Paenibacillus larvae subsp. larvae]MCY9687953.1 hypothetical protein [Paenibacillus larvae]MDT2251209.1 hypothetical protein [Paenibacillus larvae]MDV3483966.1 hypothetical protein [Paenibacillus larvae]
MNDPFGMYDAINPSSDHLKVYSNGKSFRVDSSELNCILDEGISGHHQLSNSSTAISCLNSANLKISDKRNNLPNMLNIVNFEYIIDLTKGLWKKTL